MNNNRSKMSPLYHVYKVLQILAFFGFTILYSMWDTETNFVWVVLLLIPTVGIYIASIWLPHRTRLLVSAVYGFVLLYMVLAYLFGSNVPLKPELSVASLPVLIEGALAVKCLRQTRGSVL